MKILLTGATGYIGKRLLPVLLEEGHTVVCVTRDKLRFDTSGLPSNQIEVVEVNFLDKYTLKNIPVDIDAAYYLIHSMASNDEDFEKLEERSAENFVNRLNETNARQVIYLSGIINSEKLSKHLRSRKNVENILNTGKFHTTTLRAGIIVGSGSGSFEIIRDLIEKLPVMITPEWVDTKSQPIAIRNVITYLSGVLMKQETYDRHFDIGGPEVLTYKQMLLQFAEVRNLKRNIITVPVMTPRLSSYWLYFVTSTSYRLAVNLVDSMKVPVVAKKNNLSELVHVHLIPYKTAIRLAFKKVEQQEVESSWTDAQSSNILEKGISEYIEVPTHGCFKDTQQIMVANENDALKKIWSIGGDTGWYYADLMWSIRGVLDKMVGGVGMRRGRRKSNNIRAGDAIDFWRVLYANKKDKRLLLYAEMKLPGEAWLEFKIRNGKLIQAATFRPLGLNGRLYWNLLYPFHIFIFKNMAKNIASL